MVLDQFGNITLDTIALFVFILSILFTWYVRNRAQKDEKLHAKRLRSIYRKEWLLKLLKKEDYNLIVNTLRNNLIFSTSIFSAMIIAFGFILNGYSAGFVSFLGDVKILAIVGLLAYSLLMIISEIRILIYIPIISGVSHKTIEKYESKEKIKYLSKLLDRAFDSVSNSMRALFYVITLLLWFYDPRLFIIGIIILTFLMTKEDSSQHTRITVF